MSGLSRPSPDRKPSASGRIDADAMRLAALGDASMAIRPKGFLTVTYQLRQAEPTAPAAPDPIEQLRRLAELRDAGVVTPAEFEAKKAEMLSRM